MKKSNRLTLTDAEIVIIIAAVRNMQRDIDDGHRWQVTDFIAEFDLLDDAVKAEICEVDLDELAETLNFIAKE